MRVTKPGSLSGSGLRAYCAAQNKPQGALGIRSRSLQAPQRGRAPVSQTEGFRRIFSRFEKLDIMFRAFLNFVLIVDMIKCEHALKVADKSGAIQIALCDGVD